LSNGSRLGSVALVVAVLAVVWLAFFQLLSRSAEATPTPTATRTAAAAETSTATAAATAAATVEPTPEPSPTPVPPTPTPPPTDTPTATSTPTSMPPTETPSATPELPTLTPTIETSTTLVASGTMTTPLPLALPPRGLESPFAGRVWVGLYGTPGGRGLGILGTVSPTETVGLAVQQAAAYQAVLTDTQVLPFFHMVTTIADQFPGADGDYNHRVTTGTVQLWIDVANTHNLVSVIDIQPGHSPITTELAMVESYVRQPGVHLAVDPEFMMLDGVSIPGRTIGTMTGELVNVVQAWLNGIAEAVGERKVLVIHQFEERMFSGKEVIRDYPLVDLVWDADGFGGPGAKIGDYQQYAGEPGFEYGGFKLFYNYDVPVMTPARVVDLRPRPAFVVYQ
jgi:hypothetical protein